MRALKNTKYFNLIVIAIILVTIFSGCGKNKSSQKGDMEAAKVAISVETQKIIPETIEQYSNISSKVKANNEVSVQPKISGTVKKVYVSLGDIVKAGDVLFEIDDTDLRFQVEQAEASLVLAQANHERNIGGSLETQVVQQQSAVNTYEIQYNDLVKDLENTKTLYAKGAVSKQELDNLQSSVDKAKLQFDTALQDLRLTKEKIAKETKKSGKASILQAQVALDNARTQLGYTKVKAEIDGVISACDITEGSTVSTQIAAMKIANMDKVKLSFNISDDIINRVSAGSKAYITISSASDTLYEGTVTNISPVADSQTMMYPVEIYIDNPDYHIKPGMFASIKLVLSNKENTILVPLNAVIEENNEKFVYTVDKNNIAHKTIVETGIKNDTSIEIVKGVEAGDQVVVKGQDFLSDKSTVNVTAEN